MHEWRRVKVVYGCVRQFEWPVTHGILPMSAYRSNISWCSPKYNICQYNDWCVHSYPKYAWHTSLIIPEKMQKLWKGSIKFYRYGIKCRLYDMGDECTSLETGIREYFLNILDSFILKQHSILTSCQHVKVALMMFLCHD